MGSQTLWRYDHTTNVWFRQKICSTNQKNFSSLLVFAGVNPAGARSKWPTWKKIIRQSEASVWTMQETKCSQNNKLKMDDFIIYEKVRSEKEGGGVAIAAKRDLNPVLTAEGEDEIEAISIDIHPSKIVISCTSAYGPQLRDSANKKSKLTSSLPTVRLLEVHDAQRTASTVSMHTITHL